jgi:hypothetical protein
MSVKAARACSTSSLVALGLAITQKDADLERVVEADGGQFGGRGADDHEVARAQGVLELGVCGAGVCHERMFAYRARS